MPMSVVGTTSDGRVVAGAGFTAGGGVGAGYSETITDTILIQHGKLWQIA